MKHFLLSWFFLLSFVNYGQDRTILKGKITSDLFDLADIHVINRTTKKGTTTTWGGYFEIKANVNDTLVFSSLTLQGYTHILSAEDLDKDLLLIPMKSIIKELDEVTLTEYKSITTESLGIVRKGMKKYTPAERRLLSAGTFKWYSPLLIPFGGMSIDGLINQISGKTNRLKKEVQIERKELFLQRLSEEYDDDFLVKELKIPLEYTAGFRYFAVDNTQLQDAVKKKNRTLAFFVLSQLATQYKELNRIK